MTGFISTREPNISWLLGLYVPRVARFFLAIRKNTVANAMNAIRNTHATVSPITSFRSVLSSDELLTRRAQVSP